jgi:hypothetical protein
MLVGATGRRGYFKYRRSGDPANQLYSTVPFLGFQGRMGEMGQSSFLALERPPVPSRFVLEFDVAQSPAS